MSIVPDIYINNETYFGKTHCDIEFSANIHEELMVVHSKNAGKKGNVQSKEHDKQQTSTYFLVRFFEIQHVIIVVIALAPAHSRLRHSLFLFAFLRFIPIFLRSVLIVLLLVGSLFRLFTLNSFLVFLWNSVRHDQK